jgi:hypothetical protein
MCKAGLIGAGTGWKEVGGKRARPLPLAQQGCAEFVNNASDLFCALLGTFATVENCLLLACKMEPASLAEVATDEKP